MEMLQCRFIFASLLVLNGSCQTVHTYTTKDAESLPCTITEQTPTVIWTEIVVGNSTAVLTYQSGIPHSISISTEEKYKNFNYTLEPTSFNLVIMDVEDEDGGVYVCTPFGSNPTTYDVTVEVLAKPTVKYASQDVDELYVIVGTSYDLTCSATRARSVSDLIFIWDPLLLVKIPLSITPNGDYKDYSITSTYTAVKGDSSITGQLTGYVMQDEINDQRIEHISHTVKITVQYAPVCNLNIQEGEDCREVTLTCKCDAVPADITQYSFFNDSILIKDGTSNTFTGNVAYGTKYRFSCSATNVIDSGEKSDEQVNDCNKATEPTTEKPPPTPTENPGSGLGKGAIVGISLGASAVVIVIVVITVMMFKNGKCGSKPESSSATGSNSTAKKSDLNGDELSLEVNEMKTDGKKSSSATDGNSTAKNSDFNGDELATVVNEIKTDGKKSSNNDNRKEHNGKEAPTPVYAEVKKKSDKQYNNGAGLGVDPEMTADGVIYVNTVKDNDPNRDPRSSMRNTNNSLEPPKQMDLQYAVIDHGNKPPSDEVRKPKEEPMEYATVKSVIV